jgi:imidazolonepropionase
MKTLINDISCLLTLDSGGQTCKTGKALNEPGEIKGGAIFFDENIIWTGDADEANRKLASGELKPDAVISAAGKTIMPGFVDSHTHIVFAGNRSNEFGRRLAGATYQEIAAEGGGILATVDATRKAEPEELFDNATNIAISAIRHGTTSIEIKSGYGLDFDTELKMLKVISRLKDSLPVNIVATFLGAHDFPPEYQNRRDDYVDLICNKMLPAVASEGLADFCDAFVDKGYYTVDQGRRIFETAMSLGLKIKMHADELADVNAAGLAADLGAVSADHLLFVNDANIEKMKNSGTVATLLPGTAYFLRMPCARARKIIDDGVIVAVASDCNPGSCFSENMQFILSLAAVNMRMTAAEAIAAATINGAHALNMSAIAGSLVSGKRADFIVLDTDNYTGMFYHAGVNHVSETWIKGQKF